MQAAPSAQAMQLLELIRSSRPNNRVAAVQAPTLELDQAAARNMHLLRPDGSIYYAPINTRQVGSGGDERAGEEVNPDYEAEVAAREEASKASGRRYQEFQSTGKRQGNEITWEERGGKLVQVASRPVSWSSSWVNFRETVKPAVAIAATALGAPALAGAFGGGLFGTAAAGATISGAQTALAGGNSSQILKNAALGGVTAGATRALVPLVGNVGARAIVGGGRAALTGGNIAQGAVMGGLNAVSPNAARALNILQTIQRQQSRNSAPQRTIPRKG
jgi:hypothetical protein